MAGIVLFGVWCATVLTLAMMNHPAGAQAGSTTQSPETTAAASPTSTTPDAAQLEAGAKVFNANCASCHQVGGVGLPGTFPPLKGNPHVSDPDHIRTVLAEGLSGELEVNGQIYDGKMPAFPQLGDREREPLIAYIQSGFAGTAAPPTPAAASTSLPSGPWRSLAWAVVLVGGFFALIAPGLRPTSGSGSFTWGSAWARAAAIAFGVALLVVFIPSLALESSTVSGMDRIAQDLIGTGLWLAGLVVVIVVLYRLHRRREL